MGRTCDIPLTHDGRRSSLCWSARQSIKVALRQLPINVHFLHSCLSGLQVESTIPETHARRCPTCSSLPSVSHRTPSSLAGSWNRPCGTETCCSGIDPGAPARLATATAIQGDPDCDAHACEVGRDCASSSTEGATVTRTRTGTPTGVDGNLWQGDGRGVIQHEKKWIEEASLPRRLRTGSPRREGGKNERPAPRRGGERPPPPLPYGDREHDLERWACL